MTPDSPLWVEPNWQEQVNQEDDAIYDRIVSKYNDSWEDTTAVYTYNGDEVDMVQDTLRKFDMSKNMALFFEEWDEERYLFVWADAVVHYYD